MTDVPKTLFVVQPYNRAGWYRCVLPAMFGGHDWAAIGGSPPALQMVSGWVQGSTMQPNFMDYDVVVFQQARGNRWANLMRKLKRNDKVVLYEIDDYVHQIRNQRDHDFGPVFGKDHLKSMEICMREANGIIFSTPYLAEQYQRFARRSWVCENGLDLGRYRLTRPERGSIDGEEAVTVLWSGTTGHVDATVPWIRCVRQVMEEIPNVGFVSVGQDFAVALRDQFPDRTISVPFTSLESYTSAMMMGDITLAPAGQSKWYKAKSDLRVMEAQALGHAVVADKHYSNSVEDGETGIIVHSPFEAVSAMRRLVRDRDERLRIADKARERAHAEYTMERRVDQWQTALTEAATISA